MTVGERIKRVRKQKGMTQEQVGACAGMAGSQIRKYEIDSGHPKIETLHKIADALNVDVFELIGEDPRRESAKWIPLAGHYGPVGIARCSHCGAEVIQTPEGKNWSYCPNCGHEMEANDDQTQH